MERQTSITEAFLLAAGFGTRMGSYTRQTPKPMLKVGGYPLILYSFYTLSRLGVKKVVINTHYLSEQIGNFIEGVRSALPFTIILSYEPEILGTAGGVKKAITDGSLGNHRAFYLLNTDMIVQPPEAPFQLTEMIGIKNKITTANGPATGLNQFSPPFSSFLFLKPKDDNNKATGWDLNQEGRLRVNPANGNYYYTGFSVINPRLLDDTPPDKETQLGPLWISEADNNLVGGAEYPGEIIHCGNIDEYEKIKSTIPGFLTDSKVFVEFTARFTTPE